MRAGLVVRRLGRRRYLTAWSTWSLRHEAHTETRSPMQAGRMG